MKAKSSLVQQGDVLMFSGAKIPEDAKPVHQENGRLVLAIGEATGHSHAVLLEESPGAELFSSNNAMFLSLKSPATVHHQEHKAVTLKPGKYEVRIVREIDPFTEEVRKVTD